MADKNGFVSASVEDAVDTLFSKRHGRLLEALRAGRMVSFEWDPVSDMVVRSANADEMFGPEAASESAKEFFSRVHAADRKHLEETIRSLTPARPDYEASYRYLRPSDGRELVLEDTGRAEFDGAGKLVRLRGLARDLTKQRKAEASEERLRTLLDKNPSLVFLKDEAGRYVYLNAAYASQFVHSRDWEGKTDFDLWPKESAELFRKDDAEVLRSGGTKQFLEDSRDLMGKRHCWLCYKFPITASDGGRYVGGVAIDAMEQIVAEERLRESEARYRSLFDSINEGFALKEAVVDGSGRIVDFVFLEVNPAFYAQSGLADVVGKTMREVMPNIDQPWIERFVEVVSTGKPIRFQERAGDLGRWFQVFASRVEDASGQRVAVLFNDITERKAAEERLHESEARFRAAQELSLDGFTVLKAERNADGAIVDFRWDFVNPEAGRILQHEPEELVGKSLLAVLPGNQTSSDLFRRYVQVVETGKPHDYELRYKSEGIDGWFRNMSVKLGDGIAVCFCDITERKRAEEALRESEERFRAMADGTPLIIWVSDAEGNNRYVNRAYCEFFGVTAQEVEGQKWQPLIHSEDREAYVETIVAAIRGHKPLRAQLRVRRYDGTWRWIESFAAPRFSSSGEFLGLAGCCSDVTEQKAFEAELQRLVAERTAKLQELVGELEHFSYTITHDLKSPLRAMRGFAEIAGSLCERDEPKEYLTKISTAAERMDRLIADALNYSRLVRQELPVEDVNAGALLRGMLDSYPEFQPEQAQIRLEGELPVVLANPAGLTQVFSNLLGNAVKFVNAGERPEVRIWSSERNGWIRIWVEDKGIGIPKEMMPRLFDMFARASKEYEGTGIGLALVRKVVQRMGGKVGAESEEGKGSRFWIELRCGEARPSLAIAGGVRNLAKAAVPLTTVLYVEDEESDAVFMQRAFAKKGLAGRLRVAATGRAAIDYLSGAGDYGDREKNPVPNLVLLDLNLPQISGFEVLEWMRNNPDFAHTPAVIFSSSTREDDLAKAKELGADEFVTKPSSGLQFEEVVESLQQRWFSLESA
jgi:PAS domain S-box-containing protein